MNSPLFALDIGTRAVVGIILKQIEDKFQVLDMISLEHEERSMHDGQIHNVLNVATVVQNIKDQLEQKHGPLKKVNVAAAGRALKTAKGSITIDISHQSLISTDDIHQLELAAVKEAQQRLIKSNTLNHHNEYYCVGYSVVHYQLDNEKIGSLIDQTGRHASVEVIATFLPQVVVESLLATLKRANLDIEALTLEPIAAIQVLIPPSMRKLNIALVDIGAGTSDIAIADEGTVTAYGMVPLAGDEITEALSQEYLLDFPIAESMKRELSVAEEVTVTDVLGFDQQILASEVLSTISPTIDHLSTSIATEIKRLNGNVSPQAVILIGGGSLTPHLSDNISEQLELPKNRVAIRGLEALSGVSLTQEVTSSPALVTPIGIAIAAQKAPIHYMTVTVNKETVRLFELRDMTVGDALLMTDSKSSVNQLFGRPGRSMIVTINGENLTIPGEHGTPSMISLNGTKATTKTVIKDGDAIELVGGKDGSDATATLNDLLGKLNPIKVKLNGKSISFEPLVFVNGQQEKREYVVQDHDDITLSEVQTLGHALTRLQEMDTSLSTETFTLFVNEKPTVLQDYVAKFYLNGILVDASATLSNRDVIVTEKPVPPTISDIMKEIQEQTTDITTVFFHDEEVTIHRERFSYTLNGETVDRTTLVQPNDRLDFTLLPLKNVVFSDVFAFVNYELPQTNARSYQLLRNGHPCQFKETIFDGDRLEIKFFQ